MCKRTCWWSAVIGALREKIFYVRFFCSGSLALASFDRACRIPVPAFPQRSPPRLLTAAACGGLESAPDRRSRRVLLHLSYSCAPPALTAMLVTHDPQRTSAALVSGYQLYSPISADYLPPIRYPAIRPWLTGIECNLINRDAASSSRSSAARRHGRWEKRAASCSAAGLRAIRQEIRRKRC
jgi:hypothetical protein